MFIFQWKTQKKKIKNKTNDIFYSYTYFRLFDLILKANDKKKKFGGRVVSKHAIYLASDIYIGLNRLK